MTHLKNPKVAVLIIVALVGVFYVLTIREGHDWGGDFSMYIHHAANIAEGTEYQDTGFIYNPAVPVMSPRAYPPVFPIMLSPIYKLFGLNFGAMKTETIAVFLVALAAVFAAFAGQMSARYLVPLVAVIGFNPHFWSLKDSVTSDIAFMCFVYLGLVVLHRVYEAEKPKTDSVGHAVLAGLLMYLAYGTRAVGIVLLPAVVIYELVRFKRVTRFAAIATLVAVPLMIVQSLLVRATSSYLAIFMMSLKHPRMVMDNLIGYVMSINIFWENGFSRILRLGLFGVLYVLAVVGYLRRVRTRVTVLEILVPLYLVILLAFGGYSGSRYLVPVIPAYLFYAFLGLGSIGALRGRRWETLAFALLIAAIAASYVGEYATTDLGPMREGVFKKESAELFQYIRNNTDKSDVLIFGNPRVVALFTDRRAATYDPAANSDEDLWRFPEEIGADYLIVSSFMPDDKRRLQPFVERHADRFRSVYSNRDFRVYKIVP